MKPKNSDKENGITKKIKNVPWNKSHTAETEKKTLLKGTRKTTVTTGFHRISEADIYAKFRLVSAISELRPEFWRQPKLPKPTEISRKCLLSKFGNFPNFAKFHEKIVNI